MINLLLWCDKMITYLKQNNIEFINGIPIIPKDMIYNDIPKHIETYQFRNEIPIEDRKQSLICFYLGDDRLFSRLETIEKDITEFKKYAGIVGFDLSPSINMLKPRQYHSILINSIYNCICALNGIKVAINARIGDIGTTSLIDLYPRGSTLVFSNLGCKGKFVYHSYLVFEIWVKKIKSNKVLIYGNLNKKDINFLSQLNINLTIISFPNHNYKNKNKKSVFKFRKYEYTL